MASISDNSSQKKVQGGRLTFSLKLDKNKKNSLFTEDWARLGKCLGPRRKRVVGYINIRLFSTQQQRGRGAPYMLIPGRLGAGLLPPVVDLDEVGPLGAAGQIDAGQGTACPAGSQHFT